MRKKFLIITAICLVLVTALSLAACNKNKTPAEEAYIINSITLDGLPELLLLGNNNSAPASRTIGDCKSIDLTGLKLSSFSETAALQLGYLKQASADGTKYGVYSFTQGKTVIPAAYEAITSSASCYVNLYTNGMFYTVFFTVTKTFDGVVKRALLDVNGNVVVDFCEETGFNNVSLSRNDDFETYKVTAVGQSSYTSFEKHFKVEDGKAVWLASTGSVIGGSVDTAEYYDGKEIGLTDKFYSYTMSGSVWFINIYDKDKKLERSIRNSENELTYWIAEGKYYYSEAAIAPEKGTDYTYYANDGSDYYKYKYSLHQIDLTTGIDTDITPTDKTYVISNSRTIYDDKGLFKYELATLLRIENKIVTQTYEALLDKDGNPVYDVTGLNLNLSLKLSDTRYLACYNSRRFTIMDEKAAEIVSFEWDSDKLFRDDKYIYLYDDDYSSYAVVDFDGKYVTDFDYDYNIRNTFYNGAKLTTNNKSGRGVFTADGKFKAVNKNVTTVGSEVYYDYSSLGLYGMYVEKKNVTGNAQHTVKICDLNGKEVFSYTVNGAADSGALSASINTVLDVSGKYVGVTIIDYVYVDATNTNVQKTYFIAFN